MKRVVLFKERKLIGHVFLSTQRAHKQPNVYISVGYKMGDVIKSHLLFVGWKRTNARHGRYQSAPEDVSSVIARFEERVKMITLTSLRSKREPSGFNDDVTNSELLSINRTAAYGIRYCISTRHSSPSTSETHFKRHRCHIGVRDGRPSRG